MTIDDIETALSGATKAELRLTEEGYQLYISRADIFDGALSFYGWVEEDDVEDVKLLIEDLEG